MTAPALAELENESQLVRRAAREPEAFALIYERNYAVILNYIYMIKVMPSDGTVMQYGGAVKPKEK